MQSIYKIIFFCTFNKREGSGFTQLMKNDFDIGTLFYILLMIIFIIAGAFGKKKKPQKVSSRAEPLINDSPEDLLARKLKELFNENTAIPEPEIADENIPETIEYEEKLDVPVADESYGGLEKTVIPEEITEQYIGSVEYHGEKADTISPEEGQSAIFIQAEDQIADEIKLSEGKDLTHADFNQELSEFIDKFDIRQGIMYSEILNRREY